jgi:hypothetical protein
MIFQAPAAISDRQVEVRGLVEAEKYKFTRANAEHGHIPAMRRGIILGRTVWKMDASATTADPLDVAVPPVTLEMHTQRRVMILNFASAGGLIFAC